MDLRRGTSFIQRRGGGVFPSVVVFRRKPLFARTGRLFASVYLVFKKSLGIYGLVLHTASTRAVLSGVGLS